MKNTWSKLKPYLRWFILGGTLFFLTSTFLKHWQEVELIQLGWREGQLIVTAFLVTSLAHLWSALVWYGILRSFRQSVPLAWVLVVYLKTNLAKYLPGNVWHFYGRIQLLKKTGISVSVAILSVVLEPLLMAASALIFALMGMQFGGLSIEGSWLLPTLGLGIVLVGLHPHFLNPVIEKLGRSKAKDLGETQLLQYYPLMPLLGEGFFVLLRGTGFILVLSALIPIQLSQIPLLYSVFSWAWCLGLIVPVPGGLGVFETSAIALLGSQFPTGLLLSSLALFRVVSILVEGFTALVAWLFGELRIEN